MWLDGSCADCAANPRANRRRDRRSYSSADDRPDCYTDRSPDTQAEAEAGYYRDCYMRQCNLYGSKGWRLVRAHKYGWPSVEVLFQPVHTFNSGLGGWALLVLHLERRHIFIRLARHVHYSGVLICHTFINGNVTSLSVRHASLGSDSAWHVHHPSLLRKRDMTPASDNLKTGEVAALPAAIEV
jgi:hypothetical protein